MSKKVLGSGDPKSKIWFIGEAPAQTELVQGKPFVGNAGMVLRRFCMQVGIDPNECFLDNIWNQRAPKDKLGLLFKNGVPSIDVAANIEDLTRRIKKYRPNVIVALGAIPTQIFTNKLKWDPEYQTFTSIQNVRGYIFDHCTIPGQKVIPTYHPSYISREGYSDHGIFLADLAKILLESDFPETRRIPRQLILNPRGGALYDVRDRLLEEGEIITLDIEYIGSKLMCVGLTNNSSWATSIGIHSETELEICKQIITCGKPLNAQNAMFDCSILEWNYKIPAFKYLEYDTMLAAHAINIELPKDLGFLNSIYTDLPHYKDMIDWKAIKEGRQSLDDLYLYNSMDVYSQHEIMDKQMSEDFAENPKLYKTFRFEMDLVRPLWEISKRGIKIDPERKKKYQAEVVQELELDNMMLTILNGGNALNVKSGDQVSEMLFDYMSLRPSGKTKKGKYKTDDKTMSSLLGRATTEVQRQAIILIRSIRQKRDLLSKFLDVEVDEDGRTRGMYNPGGTVTGRLASKKFYPTKKGHQQQNIPVRGRHIIVPDTDLLFGSTDYERAESLIVAHLTNDELMLAHHAPGADAHRLLAALFLSHKFGKEVSPEEVTKDQRVIFKKTRHAGNYMEGHITFMRDVNKVAHVTGVSVTAKQAEEYIDWYRGVNLGLKPWWLNTRETISKHKQLENMFGRVRIFYQRIDAILPEAVAYNPQGTVGDLMNIALLNMSGVTCELARELLPWHEEIPEIHKELVSLGFQTLNQVHDSIGFQFPPKNEERIRYLVHKCGSVPLTNPHTRKEFLIGQEMKVGTSWGEAS